MEGHVGSEKGADQHQGARSAKQPPRHTPGGRATAALAGVWEAGTSLEGGRGAACSQESPT